MDSQLNEGSSTTDIPAKQQETGRSTLILMLGIFSLIMIGPFFGIPAWIMGNKDLKKIKNGIIPLKESTTTRSGMILGIAGTFISPATIFIIGTVIGLSSFSNFAVQANRDALISECKKIAVSAQQYYLTPRLQGGGGNSFEGFMIPADMIKTGNGNYSLENVSPSSITIMGSGIEHGNKKPETVKVSMKVFPDRIEKAKVIN